MPPDAPCRTEQLLSRSWWCEEVCNNSRQIPLSPVINLSSAARSSVSPASPRGEKDALCSRAVSESTGSCENQDLNSLSVLECPEQASGTVAAEAAVQSVSLANTTPLKGFPEVEATPETSPTAKLGSPESKSSGLSRKASSPSERATKQLPSSTTLRPAECAQITALCLQGFSFPNPYAQEQENQGTVKSLVDSDVEQCSSQNRAASVSLDVCSPARELSRRKPSEAAEQGTLRQDSACGEGSAAAGGTVQGLDCPSQLHSRNTLPAGEVQESLLGDPAEEMPCPRSGEDSLGARAAVEPGRQVQMSLYVHCIKGLVLSLLAEEHLQEDLSSVEDVVSGEALLSLQVQVLLLLGDGVRSEEPAWDPCPHPFSSARHSRLAGACPYTRSCGGGCC